MAAAVPTFPLCTRIRLLLYVLVLIGVGALGYVEEDYSMLPVCAVIAAAAWVLVDSPGAPVRAERALTALAGPAGERPHQRSVLAHGPRVALNLIVLGAAVRAGFQVIEYLRGSQSLIVALCNLLVALMLCKLFEPKSTRNITQLIVLSLLTLVAATIFSSSSLAYFAILAAYFVAACYLIVMLNLMVETHGISAVDMPAHFPEGGAGASRRGRAPMMVLTRDVSNAARHCVFLAAPIGVLMFLLVPRTHGNPLIPRDWEFAAAQQTGFSEDVRFRDYTQISKSDRLVMKVKFSGEAGVEYTDLYFRGAVLDRYDRDKDRWIGRGSAANAYFSEEEVSRATQKSSTNAIWVHYTLLPPTKRPFVLSPSLMQDSHDIRSDPGDMIDHNSAGVVEYDATWYPDLVLTDDTPTHITPGELWREANPSDKDLPRVMVSRQITSKAREILQTGLKAEAPRPGDPIPEAQMHQVVNLFMTYLRTNYPYSLSFHKVDTNLDNTTDFLMNRGVSGNNAGGHCECFASAMVMLCRAVGLNARMVTGYHGGEYDVYTKEVLVREKYAHAWAEVYLPDEGWVLCDPSPIGGGTDTVAGSGNFVSDALALLQSMWAATVVNFDNETREAMANWFGAKLDVVLALVQVPDWGSVMAWGALLPLIALLVFLRRRAARRAAQHKALAFSPRRSHRSGQLGFLDDLLRLFARDAERRPDQTPLEFLRPRLALLGGAESDARWLVQTAYAVQFGGTTVTPALRQRIAQALKNVRTARTTAHLPA